MAVVLNITVMKRNGFSEPFDTLKIESAVTKAFIEVGFTEHEAEENALLATKAVAVKAVTQGLEMVSVDQIHDLVEDALMELGFKKVAKAYILYRSKRDKAREKGWQMDELQQAIFDNKYRHNGETFDQFIERVSGGNLQVAKLIRDKKFIFAGRILAHRGTPEKVTYSNCYVMPRPEDNIESIFDTASKLARTYSYGGGCGVDISNLRPKGAKVNNSARETSGAVSFMELYDLTTALIGQNGRRGALMISIADTHPDLEDFIEVKTESDAITKANISIRVTNDFMKAVVEDKNWLLQWHEDGHLPVTKEVRAREVFRKNAENNWDWAEAGMLYWSRIENWHLMSAHPDHEFHGVNPCAEEPLMAGGSCLLGSLNLSEFVKHPFTEKAYFDFDKFSDAVGVAVRGLNEVLDEGIERHPLQIQKDNARDWRQIGLGVMGIADMLIKLGIQYGSEESLKLSHRIGHHLYNFAVFESAVLASELGAFPKYNKDSLMKSEFFLKNTSPQVMGLVEKFGLRNSQILTIAPTGSLSTMWGISGGIEPIFATHYTRKTESLHDEGDVFYKVYTPIVKEAMAVLGTDDIPESVVTSHDLDWEDRLKMQAVWQNYIDASISSTVNLHNDATVEDVEQLFIRAWELGMKGVTIYRDGCKRGGVLTTEKPEEKTEDNADQSVFKHKNGYGDNKKFIECSECGSKIELITGGCAICMNCGHSPC